MEEWKTYKLEDLTIDGKGHYGIGAPAVKYDENKYTYLRITDINDDGSLNYAGLKSVDDPDSGKYLLKEGDIVFARTGNSTGRSYFYEPSDGQFVFAGFLIKFSIDPLKVNPRFLKYYTHSKPYYEWVQSFDTGATRGNINAQTFGSMEITLPPRDVQDRLVEILSSLDEKIKLNNRINHNLLNLAQELFDNSFIKNSCCSDTCRAASLLDIAEYLNGLAMQKYPTTDGEVGIPVLKIKELGQQACDANSDKCSESIPTQYVVNDGDIIFSWSGTLLVDFWCGGICGLNQHLFKVSSDKFPNWFVYFWTKHHLDRFIRIAKDKAVTMGHIKRGDLGKAEVIIPEASQMEELDEEIRPLISEYIDRRVENRKLQNLRDSLLPELMLGNLTF